MISAFFQPEPPEPLPTQPADRLEAIKAVLIARATGASSTGDDRRYRDLRSLLIGDSNLASILPRWMKTHRTLDEFWGFIQPKFPRYSERREFIRSEFEPVLALAENSVESPLKADLPPMLATFDSEHVVEAWNRAMERRQSDPEGAVSAAKTLLETVCKHILAELGETSLDDFDLPALYFKVAEHLNLAPSQHTEREFKKILGGCCTVAETLGTLRNRLGDSHGKGPAAVRPAPRHARLAVNLAGSMALFLTETFESVRSTERVQQN